MTRHTCRHCGARIYSRDGSGRYAWTDVADGTDVLGSGSECRANERGHAPTSDYADRATADGHTFRATELVPGWCVRCGCSREAHADVAP